MSPMYGGEAPILVTGAPRSGSTFLGKMLSLPRDVGYIDEPFNYQTGLVGIERPLAYLGDGVAENEQYMALMRRMLAGRGTFKRSALAPHHDAALRQLGRRLFSSRTNLKYQLVMRNPLVKRYLIKDPMASFAAGYLHQRLALRTVVLFRHPASTVASYKRLGWHYDLNDLTSQPELMKRYLEPILSGLRIAELSSIQAWSYFWLACYSVLDAYVAQNPDMIVVRHEDLSTSPKAEFEKLYSALRLPYGARVERTIAVHTGSQNRVTPKNNVAHQLKRNSGAMVQYWKKLLDPSEIEEIRRITAPLAAKYYAAHEW